MPLIQLYSKRELINIDKPLEPIWGRSFRRRGELCAPNLDPGHWSRGDVLKLLRKVRTKPRSDEPATPPAPL